jgi:hypothetical protein
MRSLSRPRKWVRALWSWAGGARRATLLVSVVLLVLPLTALAQDTATIVGTVTDSTVGKLKVNKSTYHDPTYGNVLRWFDPSVLVQPSLAQFYANGQAGMFGCNGNPNADRTPAFGRSCGGDQYNSGNGEVAGDWGPRNIQLGMKFTF